MAAVAGKKKTKQKFHLGPFAHSCTLTLNQSIRRSVSGCGAAQKLLAAGVGVRAVGCGPVAEHKQQRHHSSSLLRPADIFYAAPPAGSAEARNTMAWLPNMKKKEWGVKVRGKVGLTFLRCLNANLMRQMHFFFFLDEHWESFAV